MLKQLRFLIVLVAAAGIVMTVAPERPAYSMSTLKTWVNRVWPGTFPELEEGKQQPAQEEPQQPQRGETLTETEREILLNLAERKRKLDQRDALLNQREEQLRVLRDSIQQQIAELKRLQKEIEASMDAKKAQDAENLNKVVSLYDGMDPGKAAEKMQTLEPKVAVQILMKMNQRKAAALLEELPPDKAKEVTEAIVRKQPVSN